MIKGWSKIQFKDWQIWQRTEFDSQNLFPVFPFLACSFSFYCCTFPDFEVVSLGLPNPSVRAGRVRKTWFNHMLILYLTRHLELKRLNSKSSFYSWGNQVQGAKYPRSNNNRTTFVFAFCLGQQIVTEGLPSDTQGTKVLNLTRISMKTLCINPNILDSYDFNILEVSYQSVQPGLVSCPKPAELWEGKPNHYFYH